MLARVVQFMPSSDSAAQFTRIVEVTILGIVQAQAGCVAAFVEAHDDCVIGVSIWQSPAAAGRYGRECFPDIMRMLRPFLACDPKVSTFDTRELHRSGLPAGILTSVVGYLRSIQAVA